MKHAKRLPDARVIRILGILRVLVSLRKIECAPQPARPELSAVWGALFTKQFLVFVEHWWFLNFSRSLYKSHFWLFFKTLVKVTKNFQNSNVFRSSTAVVKVTQSVWRTSLARRITRRRLFTQAVDRVAGAPESESVCQRRPEELSRTQVSPVHSRTIDKLH